MKPYFLALACIAALFPGGTFALQNVSAGFAPGSLWLSKTVAAADETLKIYTVIYDSATSSIEGDVEFAIDGKSLGSSHFKLAPGETQIVSYPWTAAAGTHSFTASLRNIADTGGIATETNTVSIVVADAPPTALSQAVTAATNIFTSSSPAVRDIASSGYAAAEDMRTKGADWLTSALYSDQKPASSTPQQAEGATAGKVLAAEVYRPQTTSTQRPGMFGPIKRAVLATLLFVFSSRWLFYSAVLAVLYVLFKVAQGFFRFSRRR